MGRDKLPVAEKKVVVRSFHKGRFVKNAGGKDKLRDWLERAVESNFNRKPPKIKIK